jgi:hypothetical protein
VECPYAPTPIGRANRAFVVHLLSVDRICTACGETKSDSEFWSAGHGCKMRRCRSCVSTEQRERRLADPEGRRAVTRRYYENHKAKNPEYGRVKFLKRYHLTPLDFEGMRWLQDDCCAICGDRFGTEAPDIDHDHACCPTERTCGKCTRGLLCGHCNRGIGLFRETPEALRAAAKYLEAA